MKQSPTPATAARATTSRPRDPNGRFVPRGRPGPTSRPPGTALTPTSAAARATHARVANARSQPDLAPVAGVALLAAGAGLAVVGVEMLLAKLFRPTPRPPTRAERFRAGVERVRAGTERVLAAARQRWG